MHNLGEFAYNSRLCTTWDQSNNFTLHKLHAAYVSCILTYSHSLNRYACHVLYGSCLLLGKNIDTVYAILFTLKIRLHSEKLKIHITRYVQVPKSAVWAWSNYLTDVVVTVCKASLQWISYLAMQFGARLQAWHNFVCFWTKTKDMPFSLNKKISLEVF